MRRHLAFLPGILACLFAQSGAALADRGAITTARKVDLAEPAQRAIIAYDGTKELLILQADVKADQETKVVEFMPLPSKPNVTLTSASCFEILQKIANEHNLRYTVLKSGGRKGNSAKEQAVEIVVSKQLGPHTVTVAEVRDADAFIVWVRDFFKQNELGEPKLGDDLRKTVEDYLKRGLRFFAFDILTVTQEKKTVQPLVYEFASDHLYYPLKVTNLYGSSGTIELFIILPRLMDGPHEEIRIAPSATHDKGWDRYNGFRRSSDALVRTRSLEFLDPRIPKLVGNEPGWLFAVRYEGPLHFDEDIWVGGWQNYTEQSRQTRGAPHTGD